MEEQCVNQEEERSMDPGDRSGDDLARSVRRGNGLVGRGDGFVDRGDDPVGRGPVDRVVGRGGGVGLDIGGRGRGDVVGRRDVAGRGATVGDSGVNRGDAGGSHRLVDRGGAVVRDMNLRGRSWADIAADSQLVARVPVPFPGVQFGGRIARPKTVLLHTEAFKDVNVREVMLAVLKCVPVGTVKCLQQIPGPRYRLTFRTLDAKQLFLDKEFMLRGERIVAQELDTPALFVKVLYVPDEVSDQTVSEALTRYGKVLSVDREMYRDWPGVESGVRVAKITDLTEGIPRRFHIGSFKVESRYRGQVPQCNRCGTYGHRVATCVNEVKCFRCGQDGHVQRNCFKCFLCGAFGHVRSDYSRSFKEEYFG